MPVGKAMKVQPVAADIYADDAAMPQGSDVAYHPAIGPGRGRRRDQFSRTDIQKGQGALILVLLCDSRLGNGAVT